MTAGNVTIPNTFSSGTPAVAAEVNANFGALA
ncbi:MAG TPA: transcriptional regulator, partial [Gammaproteobacteria bacterium]|nr:transcriptional regulator [Gammaproteobacteria bacterium]